MSDKSTNGNFEANHTLPNSFGIRISGDHRVISAVETTTIAAGEYAQLHSGVTITFPSCYILTIQAHQTLDYGLMYSDRITYEQVSASKKRAVNLSLIFVNVTKRPIIVRRGQILASVHFTHEYQLGCVERESRLNADVIQSFPSHQTAYLSELYRNNPEQTMNKYFLGKDEWLDEIKSMSNYEPTAIFIAQQLFNKASFDVKQLICLDFEAQKLIHTSAINPSTPAIATIQTMADAVKPLGKKVN